MKGHDIRNSDQVWKDFKMHPGLSIPTKTQKEDH